MNVLTVSDILPRIRQDRPLIHCITNPISIQQCANAILALGGRPIMAEHPKEAAEITKTAQGILLNLGNITDIRMESIRISGETAAAEGIPTTLDAVGVACSRLRRDYACRLLSAVTPSVIKGNYSEIQALCQSSYHSSGVDTDPSLDPPAIDRCAVALAREKGAIILASGKADIVTDGQRLIHIRNGTAQLSSVTGTGCMLGALCAACLSVEPSLEAVIAACAILGISGEKARTDRGSGSFLVNLMDALSTLSAEDIRKNIHLEEIPIETI